jgi:predicted nucleotidyltransferase
MGTAVDIPHFCEFGWSELGEQWTELPSLSMAERDCLRRYVEALLGIGEGRIDEVWVFGSVARREAWPQGMGIRSDLDLLAVVSTSLPAEAVQAAIDATYPLFLQCGRLSPQFWTAAELDAPSTERKSMFVENFRRDAVLIWKCDKA